MAMRWNDIALRKSSAPGGAYRPSEYIVSSPGYRESSLRSRPFGFYPISHWASFGTTFPVDPRLSLFVRSVAPRVASTRRARYLFRFSSPLEGGGLPTEPLNCGVLSTSYIGAISFSALPLPGFTVKVYALAVGDYFTVLIEFELRSDVRGLRCNV